MKINHIICLLFFIVPFFNSCKNSTKELIDHQYLSSKTYNEFREQTRRESSENIARDGTLISLLGQLPKCAKGKTFSNPKTIDEQYLSQMKNIVSCDLPDSSPKMDYSIKLLSKKDLAHSEVYFVLLDGSEQSENRQLVAVTFDDTQLLAYREIGAFKTSVALDINTLVELKDDEAGITIISIASREVSYPISQKNRVVRYFKISEDGEIKTIR